MLHKKCTYQFNKKILRISLEKHRMIRLKKRFKSIDLKIGKARVPIDFEKAVSRKTRLKFWIWFSCD